MSNDIGYVFKPKGSYSNKNEQFALIRDKSNRKWTVHVSESNNTSLEDFFKMLLGMPVTQDAIPVQREPFSITPATKVTKINSTTTNTWVPMTS